MQNLFNTTQMFPEDWVTPGEIGSFYNGMMEVLQANSPVFEALGNTSIVLGATAICALPLIWVLTRLNRV